MCFLEDVEVQLQKEFDSNDNNKRKKKNISRNKEQKYLQNVNLTGGFIVDQSIGRNDSTKSSENTIFKTK